MIAERLFLPCMHAWMSMGIAGRDAVAVPHTLPHVALPGRLPHLISKGQLKR